MTGEHSSTKRCTWCKIDKLIAEFANDKNRSDGKHPHCRSCLKARASDRYLSKKKEYNEKARANYANNKDAYKDRARKWAQANPEKRREVTKAYLANNPAKRYETQKNNRLRNPGMYAEHFKARQQRKAMPDWANRENIKAIYRQSAWVTKVTGVKHHVDHYYPLKNDLVCGLHNEFNLRIIPARDNLVKWNQFPE